MSRYGPLAAVAVRDSILNYPSLKVNIIPIAVIMTLAIIITMAISLIIPVAVVVLVRYYLTPRFMKMSIVRHRSVVWVNEFSPNPFLFELYAKYSGTASRSLREVQQLHLRPIYSSPSTTRLVSSFRRA